MKNCEANIAFDKRQIKLVISKQARIFFVNDNLVSTSVYDSLPAICLRPFDSQDSKCKKFVKNTLWLSILLFW